MVFMRPTRGLGIALALLLCPQAAQAQDGAPPFDPAIDVQLFEYATGRHTFLTVADADVQGHKQFSLHFIVTFLTDPFVVHNVDENEDEIIGTRTTVVESLTGGEIGGAVGFKDKFELGVALPVVFRMTGEGLTPENAGPAMDPLSVTGLGDLRVELKYLAWRKDRLRLAVIPGLTIPTSVGSGGGDFLGDNTPAGRARAAFQWTDAEGKLQLGVNAGILLRKPRQIYNSEVGQQLIYAGGVAFKATDKVSVVGEMFGRAGLFNVDLDASPLEAAVGVRIMAGKSFSVLAGGGTGLVKGIGSPGARFFVSVGWAPDTRDEDGDGIANNKDKCPLLAEDKDGWEDSDGCPDDDNDGDKREDAVDKCPNEAEDLDGFDDDDGCPEADNDKDGFNDTDDKCPLHPEDKVPPFDNDGCPANMRDSDDDGVFDSQDQCPEEYEDADGFEDWDGCPDVDNDGDDLPDEFDKCPLCKEDIDGFEDDDGCPEVDNDGDGIEDAADNCPSEPETINGVDDFDGCPDSGGAQQVTLDGDRVQIDGDIKFRRGRLTSEGRAVVDQLALVMKMNPDVAAWRVVVAAPRQRNDEATRAESQARADAIKAQVVSRGVAADAIEAIGAVSDNATIVVIVRERRAQETNEDDEVVPMCPTGMEAYPRPQPATPAPAPTAELSSAPAPAPAAAEPEPAPAAAPVPSAFSRFAGRSEKIKFRKDAPDLNRRAKRELDKIAKLMTEHDFVHITIEVYTDDSLGADEAKAVTQAQADAVSAHLVGAGVSADRIHTVSRGSENTIGKGAKSRRVVLDFESK